MPNSSDAAELQSLFEGVDHARSEAEAVWGAERLPIIIGDEWRTKLRRQQVRWSEALQAAWAADSCTAPQMQAVRDSAAAMCRAWPKLGEVATEAGHRPLHVDVWEARLADGTVAAIVRNNDAAAHVIADGRHLVVYTLEEVGNVIDALPAALGLAKIHFPGAKVGPPRDPVDKSWVKHGDAIPFGDEAAA